MLPDLGEVWMTCIHLFQIASDGYFNWHFGENYFRVESFIKATFEI